MGLDGVELDVTRQEVRLDSDLRILLAGKPMPQTWAALRTATGALRWPDLVRPRWLDMGIRILTITVFAGMVHVAMSHRFTSSLSVRIILGLACGSLIAWLMLGLTRQFCTHVPRTHALLRHLLYFVETSPPAHWTRDRVAYRVKCITMAQLELKEDQYRETADFIRDLGLS